jgi:hypothetical protein
MKPSICFNSARVKALRMLYVEAGAAGGIEELLGGQELLVKKKDPPLAAGEGEG